MPASSCRCGLSPQHGRPVRDGAVNMKRTLPGLIISTVAAATAAAQAPAAATDPLIARAKSLELNTPYVPPPGDPLLHHTAGYAKVMCSAVFITGLDAEFAAENIGYFT